MFPTLTLNFDVVFNQFDDSFQDNLANDLASFENAAYKQLADKKAKAKTVSKASAKVVKRPNAKEVIQKPSISKATPPSGQPRHGYYGLPPAKGPFGCMRCRAAPKRCANCREPTFEGLRFANRAQWQAWKDAKDCQKKWRANALPLLANFFWCKATYSLPMGLYMPMPMVMEVILDLASKCSAVCIQPTTFLLSTHFRFGQNKKHWMLAAQVQTNLPQGRQKEWARLMAMKQGAMAMATLTNGTDHWHSTGQVHQWHWTSSSMWAHTHPASGHLLHSAPVTNHEEGATNAQCQRAQAPALLMKRCVSSMTRLPLVILWQLGLHVLCFLFAHMFSPGLTGLMQQQNFFI